MSLAAAAEAAHSLLYGNLAEGSTGLRESNSRGTGELVASLQVRKLASEILNRHPESNWALKNYYWLTCIGRRQALQGHDRQPGSAEGQPGRGQVRQRHWQRV